MGEVGRQQRVLVRKTGRVLDRLAAEKAILRANVAKLTTDLEASKPHTRKTVKENPNDGFATLKDIVAAQKASERAPKRRRANQPVIDEAVVQEAQDCIIHGLERIRDLEES
ncbi:hypothetical protein QBC37DRAFT_64392 [Rhypophila decipiens]|uniref:Uncharacterized protein n=1 Tax=Rhypophila decipiens TaxID=261697 RepID=A0AAN6XYF1_9PEZI|nr:hypothetical protein QBC37DRAFT_64392 [Rhypophila decipiens]